MRVSRLWTALSALRGSGSVGSKHLGSQGQQEFAPKESETHVLHQDSISEAAPGPIPSLPEMLPSDCNRKFSLRCEPHPGCCGWSHSGHHTGASYVFIFYLKSILIINLQRLLHCSPNREKCLSLTFMSFLSWDQSALTTLSLVFFVCSLAAYKQNCLLLCKYL